MKPTIEELKEALEDLTSEGFMSVSYQSIKLNNAITELGELRTWKEESIKSLIGYGETTAAVLTLQAKLEKAVARDIRGLGE